MTRTGRRDLTVTGLVVVAVTALLVGRSLGRGLYLYRDFVTVPAPVVGAATWGTAGDPPRSAPLDAVVVALSPVVPPGVQQQVMLVSCLLLAGLGTGLLVRSWGLGAMVPAAVLAMWNPWVVERLLLGQPPTLLAYSMTPWVVLAVRSRLGGRRALLALAAAAVPAALTPWGGVSALVTALVTAMATPWRRGWWCLGAAGLGVAWCLPWLVPSFRYAVAAADRDGANAFAVQADSPLGVLGSVATLGGVWGGGAVPASRSGGWSVAAGLVLLALAATGVVVLRRSGRRGAAGWLGAALIAPPLAVTVLATAPGVAFMRVAQEVPGLALARDTHRWIAPTVTATAVLVGVTSATLARVLAARGRVGAAPAVAVVAVACSVVALTVPDAPKVLHAAYQPVRMPPGWAHAVASADRAAGDKAVLVLPWSAFRAARTPAGYNAGRPFLDPLERALVQEVVRAEQLVVVRDGREVVVDDDPPAAAALAANPTPESLRAAGIGAVVVWKDVRGPDVPSVLGSLERVSDSGAFEVWRVTRP